ncbi:GntR family transcriptional regulator [Hoeflea prorocentri]|uniref:GntR family transcriptional regulator n=1 Tax=Hoeflea prorocentri TaxID=1922333 RepID=A0A9X3UHY0_9HYPH|nr:GntR family transcriptional regulator [Hoeflea prorocentri]MCY6381145.1 GntR family transcriptional regulator [Hoeflea prorocentri]MDA5398945.1 GntR family transcriptional regulator [Hoeflea prorocentri]
MQQSEQAVTQEPKAQSQTQRAVSELKRMIVSSELPAGSSYLETELAEMLGMSRTPVREATLMLEAQGLVEVRPRRGVRILSISPDDMEEIYQILTELECLAAERVAERCDDPVMLEPLREASRRMETALEADNREAWAKADEDFHSRLLDLSGSERLKSVIANFNDQVRRARALTLYIRPAPQKSNADHLALIDALEKGDGPLARRIHRDHRIAAKSLMISLLRKHGFHQV